MCHNESTALTFNNVDQCNHRWQNQCLYCCTNVKELNSVYFLLLCLVGAAAGILSLTNLTGFLFFFVLLLFSVLCVSAYWCMWAAQNHGGASINDAAVTNFIQSYLHQFFDNSHGLKASLKPLRRPFDRCQSHLEAINNGRDIKQINW